MLKRVFSGKTVNDAKNKGLIELGVSEDAVSITVLEQPSKGLFGLFGVREAKVEITLLEAAADSSPERGAAPDSPSEEEFIEQTKHYLKSILHDMGVDANIERSPDEYGTPVLEITGNDLGLVIGRRGQTLDALQTLANVFANRLSDAHIRLILDAEGFRERRRKTLQDLSLRLANQVVRTRKDVVLEPMPSNERRIIHYQLQNHPKVRTFSKGAEPNRRIVITLKS